MSSRRNKLLLSIAISVAIILGLLWFYSMSQSGDAPVEPSNPGYVTTKPSVTSEPTPTSTPTEAPSPTPTYTVDRVDISDLLPPLADEGEAVSDDLFTQAVTQLDSLLYDYLLLNPGETLAQRNMRLEGKIADGSPLWLAHPILGELTEDNYSSQDGSAGYYELGQTGVTGGWLDDFRMMVEYKYTYVYPAGSEMEQDIVLTSNYYNAISLKYNTQTKKWELNKLGRSY